MIACFSLVRFSIATLGAHHEAAAAGFVGLGDAALAVEKSAGREVGPLHVLEHFEQSGFGILHQLDGGVNDFSQVVRRNVRRHADRDAVRPVDDQRGNPRGQNRGLVGGLIEVGHHVDGFHLDVGHHLFGDALHAALGVPIGRGRIAIDRTKVSLAIDQRIAQRPRLRHAHQRVVHRRVAVRMVLLQALAHHAGALGVALVVLQALSVHGRENAAMHGLQSVAGIGQRAPDDHRHRVGEIRAAHLLFNVDGDMVGAASGGVPPSRGSWGF